MPPTISAVHTVVEQYGQVGLFNRPEFAIVFFFFSRKRDPENLPGSRQRLNEATAMRGVNQGNADNVGTVWCFQNSNLRCELSTMVGENPNRKYPSSRVSHCIMVVID